MHDELLSVVIAPGDEPERIFRALDQLAEFLSSRFKNYEIITICDHSSPAHAQNLAARVSGTRNLRVLTLARHYGTSVATLAGLQHAIGDYTVLLNVDTPPELIDELFDAMTPEYDVVFAVDDTQHDLKNRFLRWTEKLSQVPVVTGHAHAALMRRQSLNAILTLRERIAHLPLLAAYLGLRINTVSAPTGVPLAPKRLLQQLETICAYSPWPLVAMASLMLVITVLATLLALLQWIFSGFEGAHFTVLVCMLAVTGLSGMMTLMTSFTGRILQETKRQPFYQMVEEKSSRKVEIESIVQRR